MSRYIPHGQPPKKTLSRPSCPLPDQGQQNLQLWDENGTLKRALRGCRKTPPFFGNFPPFFGNPPSPFLPKSGPKRDGKRGCNALPATKVMNKTAHSLSHTQSRVHTNTHRTNSEGWRQQLLHSSLGTRDAAFRLRLERLFSKSTILAQYRCCVRRQLELRLAALRRQRSFARSRSAFITENVHPTTK